MFVSNNQLMLCLYNLKKIVLVVSFLHTVFHDHELCVYFNETFSLLSFSNSLF